MKKTIIEFPSQQFSVGEHDKFAGLSREYEEAKKALIEGIKAWGEEFLNLEFMWNYNFTEGHTVYALAGGGLL